MARYNARNVNVLIEESAYFALQWTLAMCQSFYVLAKTGEFMPFYFQRRKRGATDRLGVMNGNTRELREVLGHEELFSWFLRHLGAELSVNVMTALIEFVQLQRLCYDSTAIDAKSERIRIPDDAPDSAIVFADVGDGSTGNALSSTVSLESVQEKYYVLYRKYVSDGASHLQLALSAKARQWFDAELGSKRKWMYENADVNSMPAMVKHLDRAIGEVYHLADEAFARFVALNGNELFKRIPSLYMNSLSARN